MQKMQRTGEGLFHDVLATEFTISNRISESLDLLELWKHDLIEWNPPPVSMH